MNNIKYLASIDPGKKTSAMVVFDIRQLESPKTGSQLLEFRTIDTPFFWDENYLWLKFLDKSTTIIVIETGYISQKHKGVTADHILLCGRIIGGLTAKGYDVREASPLQWIPDMLSTGGRVPNNAQVAKLMKAKVDSMLPGVKMDEHQRAAYLIGMWYWTRMKFEGNV